MPSISPGSSAASCVSVYDEPDHEQLLLNEFVYAYRVQIKPGAGTLWHKHTEDTVYVSFGNATGREEIDDGNVVITDIPCGAAVSRPHRDEPLIHQVTNVGDNAFHLVGAERLASPAPGCAKAITDSSMELALETPRFRTYRFSFDADDSLMLARAGLLIFAPTSDTQRSQVIWVTSELTHRFDSAVVGFFAEWR